MEQSNGNPPSQPLGLSDRPLGQVGWRAPEMPHRGSAFPPIADYGFLSDCETVALVAPSGNIEWICLPRLDSPSVFGAMLDRGAGSFKLGPVGINVPASRRYLPGTMVLETSWWTGAGWIIVRDALLIGGWHHEDKRSHTHRRAPTDYDADHVLLRTVRCVNGEVEIALDCEPAYEYGRQSASWEYVGSSYRVDETDDGLSGEEGSFLICSFWLVSAPVEIGQLEEARDMCERVLGYTSPLGLYSEEVDPRTGRHLGNFPQAFTHLALINAVMHVIRADQQLAMTRSPFDEPS